MLIWSVDEDGTPLVGLSLNARLRDIARFGEVMRLGGHFNGQQIVPAAVVERDSRRRESRGVREGRLRDAARLELSQPVVGIARRPWRRSWRAASTGRRSTSIRKPRW